MVIKQSGLLLTLSFYFVQLITMIAVLGTILSTVAFGYATPVNPYDVIEPEKQFLVNPHRLLEGNSITVVGQVYSLRIYTVHACAILKSLV